MAMRHALPFLVACLAVAGFSLMDALMKEASLAVGALSALFWRNALGIAMAAPLWLSGPARFPRGPALRLHMRRAAVVAAMAFLFFWALTRLPIAEAVAISFVAPVMALAMAGLLLGERVGREAMLAGLLGSAGVAVIMAGRLSGGYDGTALPAIGAVLLSAALFAYNLILARRQALLAGPIEIAFFQCLFVTLFMTPLAAGIGLPEQTGQWLGIGAAALLSLIGIALLAWAYARAEAQALIPVEYTGFVWAALFGWLFFAERPDWPVILGATLIVTGSLIAARARGAAPVGEQQAL